MVTENARRLSDTPAEGVDMLWRLPKVELHLHLEGAMRPATVCAQARRYEPNAPFCHDGWQAGFWSFSDLTTALAASRQVTRVAFRSADDYYLIARECFEDLAAQQVIYALVAYLVQAGVVLDVCPTCNVRTGLAPSVAAHPIRALHEAGVRVTVSSDDPLLLATNLTAELVHLHRDLGFSLRDLGQFMVTAAAQSFQPAPVRASLVRALQDAWPG